MTDEPRRLPSPKGWRPDRPWERTYPCPCCGYLTSSGPGSYDICPICFWEDDLAQLRFATEGGGANDVSLLEGQANHAAFGACEPEMVPHVRAPLPTDRRDPSWRPIDLARDDIEVSVAGTDHGRTYPRDPTALYYWRPTYWRRRPKRTELH